MVGLEPTLAPLLNRALDWRGERLLSLTGVPFMQEDENLRLVIRFTQSQG
jgi:hypothetical protein